MKLAEAHRMCASATWRSIPYNRRMTSSTSAAKASTESAPALSRQALLAGLSLAIVGAVLFSAKAIIAKLLYRYHIDAVEVTAFRMLFAFPFFVTIGIVKSKGSVSLTKMEWGKIVIIGLTGYYLSSFLDFLGLQYITAGLERLILFLTPSFVLLISVVFLHKRITLVEWAALGTAYLGTVFVFIHDAMRGGSNVMLGGALVLASAFMYAIYLLLCGGLVRKLGSLLLVAYAMTISSVACVGQYFVLRPAHLLLEQPWQVYGLSLVNAVFCTVMPVIMTMVAVERIGAPTASQAGMIGPVSTLFLGAIVLGEPITAIQLVGTALVVAGIYLLSKKK
jgi:drug/metabolite transporter (DMT)-like permease